MRFQKPYGWFTFKMSSLSADKNFQPILFTYPFKVQLSSEYVLKQEFQPKCADKCVIFNKKLKKIDSFTIAYHKAWTKLDINKTKKLKFLEYSSL